MGHQAISDIATSFFFLLVIILKAEAAPQDSPEPSSDNLPRLQSCYLYNQIPEGEYFLGSGKFLGFFKGVMVISQK